MSKASSPPMTATAEVGRAGPRRGAAAVPVRTRAVGGFFLAMGGVHLGIVAADPETYRHFADGALFGFVRTGWRSLGG